MTNTFLVADPHFGHAGVCRFTDYSGNKIRPWTCPDEMDEALVANWNSVVKPSDRVYVLGDVVINRRCLPTIGRCNGRKVLVKGNHDIFKAHEYLQYFDDIRSSHIVSNMVLSHIPIHEDSLSRWPVNIHGHLHTNVVMKNGQPDPRYFCVSVEQINFTPISLNQVLAKVKERLDINDTRE